MKNSSIAARALLAACFTAALPGALAQDSMPAAATPASPANCAFLPDAPDQHTVVRGDTLWGIAGKFLQNPWCWPQVWGLNKDQIRNPHWIYPGQIVYFDRNAGRLRLGTPLPGSAPAPAAEEPAGTVRMFPQARSEAIARQAIPTIRADHIGPFLVRPLVIEEDSFRSAPVIAATPEGRVYLARGDMAYVRGDLKGVSNFQAYRPGQPLRDPETGEVIAFEARYLGALKLDRAAGAPDEAHRFLVTDNSAELGVGDRLIALPSTPTLNVAPHAPARPVKARVMSIYGESFSAGQNQVVSVNRGARDGLDVGSVLEVMRAGSVVRDRTNGNAPLRLPENKVGTLLVFRVYDQVAYGLVMQSTDAIVVGDPARSPD